MESKRVVAISGWRGMSPNNLNYVAAFETAMLDFNETYGFVPGKIVTGGAKGADQIAKNWAHKIGIEVEEMLPDYDSNGEKAPLMRNTDIVNASDYLVAFPHDSGSGTQDAIRKAKKLGKNVMIINVTKR